MPTADDRQQRERATLRPSHWQKELALIRRQPAAASGIQHRPLANFLYRLSADAQFFRRVVQPAPSVDRVSPATFSTWRCCSARCGRPPGRNETPCRYETRESCRLDDRSRIATDGRGRRTCESREPGHAQTDPPTSRIANVTSGGHPRPPRPSGTAGGEKVRSRRFFSTGRRFDSHD